MKENRSSSLLLALLLAASGLLIWSGPAIDAAFRLPWLPPATSSADLLLEEIQTIAQREYQPPVDARIDPVWKAIPAYDGLQVDVEATYQLALSRPGEPLHLVYEVLPAQVDLDDLPPAPIYRGNPHKPMVSLMVNVAWGTEYIPEMLDIFAREQVKATFFLDGKWLEKNPDVARTIVQAGHEIGNHAYSHPAMSRLSREEVALEIGRTQELIRRHLDVESRLFAPPAGDYNQQVVAVGEELGLKTVLWTLDTVDWRHPSASSILARLVPRIEPGCTILMHPTPSALAALPPLIREVKGRGLALGTVSQLLSPKRLEPVEPLTFF